MVKLPNGKRRSKVVESFGLAKAVEAKFKIESVEQDILNLHKSPSLSDIFRQYLAWAKCNKKTWKEDQDRWMHHVEPHLRSMRMATILDIKITTTM